MSNAQELRQQKVELLRRFNRKVRLWNAGAYFDDKEGLRAEINALLPLARQIVMDIGCFRFMGVSPPPALGGAVLTNIDPFASLFTSFWGMSVTSEVMDMVNSAIGVLENPLTETLMGKGKVAQDHPQNPLPVVVSALFEQSSDTIVDIIGLCGVEVDWTLTKEEAYSNATRKRA